MSKPRSPALLPPLPGPEAARRRAAALGRVFEILADAYERAITPPDERGMAAKNTTPIDSEPLAGRESTGASAPGAKASDAVRITRNDKPE